jgi:hypothetical protein
MPYLIKRSSTLSELRFIDWVGMSGVQGNPLSKLHFGAPLSEDDLGWIKRTTVLIGPPPQGQPRRLPDVFDLGPYVVTQKVANLFEEMQPGSTISIKGAHEATNQPIDGLHIIYLNTHLKCVDETSIKWSGAIDEERRFGFPLNSISRVSFISPPEKRFHAWAAAAPLQHLYFVSDELHAALQSEKTTGGAISAAADRRVAS